MKKEKIAFLDNSFHKKTNSSNFFKEILNKNFDIDNFYLENDPRSQIREIILGGYDKVICWQTEFCAPYFLMLGMKVICIPMYDGICLAPDYYWNMMRQARFITFSKKLHSKFKLLNMESYYFQYYQKNEIINLKTQNKVFFWNRIPQKGIDEKCIRRIMHGFKYDLHIHDAPDVQIEDDNFNNVDSISFWNLDKNVFLNALSKCNIYITPRYSEGIGIGISEAFSRGMFVVAHNNSIHDDYIVDGINGVLIDFNHGNLRKKFEELNIKFNDESLNTIRINAYNSNENGYKFWITQSKSIPFLISSTPNPTLSKRQISFANNYLDICKHLPNNLNLYFYLLKKFSKKEIHGYLLKDLSYKEIIKIYIKNKFRLLYQCYLILFKIKKVFKRFFISKILNH